MFNPKEGVLNSSCIEDIKGDLGIKDFLRNSRARERKKHHQKD
jgi:hypothetical protein